MSKGLLDRWLSRVVKRGLLEVTYASGKRSSFGEPAEGFPQVALRFTDDKVPRDLLLDPRLGAGEVEGPHAEEPLVEQGDDLLAVLVAAPVPLAQGPGVVGPQRLDVGGDQPHLLARRHDLAERGDVAAGEDVLVGEGVGPARLAHAAERVEQHHPV